MAQVKTPQSLLFLLRFSHLKINKCFLDLCRLIFWVNIRVWLTFRVLKKLILAIFASIFAAFMKEFLEALILFSWWCRCNCFLNIFKYPFFWNTLRFTRRDDSTESFCAVFTFLSTMINLIWPWYITKTRKLM